MAAVVANAAKGGAAPRKTQGPRLVIVPARRNRHRPRENREKARPRAPLSLQLALAGGDEHASVAAAVAAAAWMAPRGNRRPRSATAATPTAAAQPSLLSRIGRG